MSKKLNLGDKVTWASQAGGHTTVKNGVIVEVIKAHENVVDNGVINSVVHKYNARPKISTAYSRDHDSYLVLVPQEGSRKPLLYWPLVKYLRKTGRNVRALKK